MKRIRYLPLGTNSRKWLEEYLTERELLLRIKEEDIQAVFISNQMRRISTRSIYRIFEKFDTHPHAARHTLLTKLVRRGNDLVTVKEIAGHSNIIRLLSIANQHLKNWLFFWNIFKHIP